MINIGSILFIFIYFNIIRKSRGIKSLYVSSFAFSIILELTVSRGFFIQIGQQQIAYRTIAEVLLFILSVMILLKKPIKRKVFFKYAALFLCILIGWAGLIFSPSDVKGATMNVPWEDILTGVASLQDIRFVSGMYTEIIQVIIYIVIALCAWSNCEFEDWKFVFRTFLKYSRFYVYVGLVEFIMTYISGTNLFHKVVDAILGNSQGAISTVLSRGGGYTLTGLTQEASQYSFTVMMIIIFNILGYLIDKSNNDLKAARQEKIAVIMSLFLSIVMMSFSSYLNLLYVFAFTILLVSELRGNSFLRMWTILIISFGCCVLIIALLPTLAKHLSLNSFLGRRINSLVEEMTTIGSGTWLTSTSALEYSVRVRLGSAYETFKLSFARPLFGLGFAATTAHSPLAMLLSGCGFVGSFIYIKTIFYPTPLVSNKRDKALYLSCIIIFIAITFLNSMSLRPFYETWNIAFAMAIRYFLMIRHDASVQEYMLQQGENTMETNQQLVKG